MLRITIPERYQPGFHLLATLKADEYDELLTAVQQKDTIVDPDDLVHAVLADGAGLADDDAHRLANSILSLYDYGISIRADAEDLGRAVVESIGTQKTADADVALTDAQIASLGDRVTALLRAPAVSLTAKAVNLLSDQDKLLLDVRIITDLRFLFEEGYGGEVSDPHGAVSFHTLKLTYRTSTGSDDSFYVAMDDRHLVRLTDAATRAHAKAHMLRQKLDELDLPSLDTAGDE